jgi:hypothetical protein
MFQKKASRPLFWGLVALGALSCGPVMAQETSTPAPLKQPSAFEAIDQAAKTNTFWSESSIGEDAKEVFLIDRGEARVQRRSERFETVYLDLMKQQSDSGTIMRTQDISNTYNTSLLEMPQQ